jgi:endonuclease III
MKKADREAILTALEGKYKGMKTALHYKTPFELLCAVIFRRSARTKELIKLRLAFSRGSIPRRRWVL